MEYKLLNHIKKSEDVKKLNIDELKMLCGEVRDCMINTVSQNGGHLASNLGVVELTVAIHKCFNCPEDSVLFDVGHQSYTHKLLTGRYEKFGTIRTENGISGFMRPEESECDPFVTGHSSNSISASLGIYKSKLLQGKNAFAVTVVGDGALTGGMAYEALNNAGVARGGFIVILNDNKMSISKNVGGLARHLAVIRSKPSYHNFKRRLKKVLDSIPKIGPKLTNKLFKSKTMFKNAVYKSNIFETMGFNYMGPIDGHDLDGLITALEIAKSKNRPVLLHTVTVKGKGYSFAESDPKNYHGVSSFDIEKGADTNKKTIFSDVCGKTLCDLAEQNEKVCAITAAMTQGTGLSEFSEKYRSRFFDVGIAEEHAVTFAAGLASGGLKPYFVVYSSFLQRSYDQLIHDVAIANLPVRLCIDRAGIVGEDGESHQGLFDAAFLSTVPNMKVYSPSSFSELEDIIRSTIEIDGPVAIRYPRGAELLESNVSITDADYQVFGSGKKVIVTYGRIFANALKAQESLKDTAVLKLNKIHPLSNDLIKELSNYNDIYFFEEGIKSGGIAEQLGSLILESGNNADYRITAIEDEFVPQSTVGSALKKYKFDVESMIKIVKGEI